MLQDFPVNIYFWIFILLPKHQREIVASVKDFKEIIFTCFLLIGKKTQLLHLRIKHIHQSQKREEAYLGFHQEALQLMC